MTRFRLVIGGIVTGIWAVGYIAAFFVDRSLEPLAQSITPVMMLVVGAIFGTTALELVRGKQPDDEQRTIPPPQPDATRPANDT